MTIQHVQPLQVMDALCGGHHPPGEACMWCARADVDARLSHWVTGLYELGEAADRACADWPDIPAVQATRQDIQEVAAALKHALTVYEDRADVMVTLALANALPPAPSAAEDTCECAPCRYMRGLRDAE